MDDGLVQELRAAKDPAEKAAIIAEAVLNTLPQELALLARRCVILHWFDSSVLATLFQVQSSAPDGREALYQRLAALPFIEVVPWGLTFQDLTREGLLRRYTTTYPSLLKASARRAASAYAAQSDATRAAEAFYCSVVAGDQQACAEILNTLLAHVSTHQDWHVMRCLLSLKEEAEDLLGGAPLPLTEQFWLLAGLAHWNQGEHAIAIRDYERAISLNPKSALVYASRGNARAEQQHYQQALADYNRALEIDPTFTHVYIRRGMLAYAQKRYQPALKDFERALQFDAHNVFALYQKGKTLNELGQYEDATVVFERALQDDSLNADIYTAKGDALYGLEQYTEALATYNMALSLNDRLAVGYKGKGNALQALKRYAEATVAYERARGLETDTADTEEPDMRDKHESSIDLPKMRREERVNAENVPGAYEFLDDHFQTTRLRRPSVPPSSGRQRYGLFQYRLGRGLALATAIFIVLASVILFRTLTSTHTGAPPPNSVNGIGITKVSTNEYIGISDGSYILDRGTDRADANYKQQAANAFLHTPNGISTAISLYNQAISVDSNDAEAHIYQEDLSVISSDSLYVTLVVGTMLSGDDATVGTGRDDLQGAYIAQKEFNDSAKLGNLKVRLLVASSGSQADYAKTIANQIVQLAQSDKTFVGVMGWPYSSHSVDAVGVLSAHHIPMVSQTSSSDSLTYTSPYFFRVVPANTVQGIEGASYAENTLHTSRAALFFDTKNPYSQSLANDFKTQFTQDGRQIAVEEHYTVGHTETLQTLLADAMSHSPDIIYFSGYSSDVSVLLTDLPSSAGTIPVLGGDALYQLHGYTTSARGNFTHLHFTAFAYPDEWGVQQLQEPNFFQQYPAAFDPNRQHTANPYGYIRPDTDAILSYDAMIALLTSCSNALSGGKQTMTSEDLRQGLTLIKGSNAIQGVSGQIAFGPAGDPVNKAIVILTVDSNGFIKMVPPVLGTFLKQ